MSPRTPLLCFEKLSVVKPMNAGSLQQGTVRTNPARASSAPKMMWLQFPPLHP
jgi:hypothetical protein